MEDQYKRLCLLLFFFRIPPTIFRSQKHPSGKKKGTLCTPRHCFCGRVVLNWLVAFVDFKARLQFDSAYELTCCFASSLLFEVHSELGIVIGLTSSCGQSITRAEAQWEGWARCAPRRAAFDRATRKCKIPLTEQHANVKSP